MTNDFQADDKKEIEEEEKEKMLNENNEKNRDTTGGGVKPAILEIEEGREVKPKKIPIGGIKMPGFFTRSRSKEKCKDDEDATELNPEYNDTDKLQATPEEEEKKSPSIAQRIKLPGFFNKKQLDEPEDKLEIDTETPNRPRSFWRAPFIRTFSRLRPVDEPTLNTAAQAGLASVETLGDDAKIGDDSAETEKLAVDNEKPLDLEAQTHAEKPGYIKFIKENKRLSTVVLVFLLINLFVLYVTLSGPRYPKSAPIEDGKYITAVTSCGKVQGVVEDSAFAFRGVPYAVQPINDRRWTKAAPLNSLNYCWNGTLKAHNVTPSCWQIYKNNSISGVEDCLTLDVITPHVRYDNPLPVVVLIGSETFIGDSPSKLRPSARFSRQYDVVFVRPNFRVGVMGFLALDILSKDSRVPTSGNYALSDILAALQWIHLNIEHFGGDKNSVTLFGHRTGATIVTALSTSKKITIKTKDGNKMLFHRAWATSGSTILPGKELQEYEKANFPYLEYISCIDVFCAREREPSQLLQQVPDVWRHNMPELPTADEEPDKSQHEWLVLDGEILGKHPVEAWLENKSPIQLVLGTTAHASATDTLFMLNSNWTEEVVKRRVQESILGKMGLIDEVWKRYNATYQGLVRIISDIRTVCPLLSLGSQLENATVYVANMTGGSENIADVDADISAIFGRYEAKTPEQRRFASAIQQFFLHFVWHGHLPTNDGVKGIHIIDQDLSFSPEYPNCAFWVEKDIVPKFATVD